MYSNTGGSGNWGDGRDQMDKQSYSRCIYASVVCLRYNADNNLINVVVGLNCFVAIANGPRRAWSGERLKGYPNASRPRRVRRRCHRRVREGGYDVPTLVGYVQAWWQTSSTRKKDKTKQNNQVPVNVWKKKKPAVNCCNVPRIIVERHKNQSTKKKQEQKHKDPGEEKSVVRVSAVIHCM